MTGFGDNPGGEEALPESYENSDIREAIGRFCNFILQTSMAEKIRSRLLTETEIIQKGVINFLRDKETRDHAATFQQRNVSSRFLNEAHTIEYNLGMHMHEMLDIIEQKLRGAERIRVRGWFTDIAREMNNIGIFLDQAKQFPHGGGKRPSSMYTLPHEKEVKPEDGYEAAAGEMHWASSRKKGRLPLFERLHGPDRKRE